MSLIQRSIRSISWTIVAKLSTMAVGFTRAVLLARLLPVDVFGTYALANSVIAITLVAPNFGMIGAFLHRSPETENENQAASVHFTLVCIFTMIWAAILLILTLAFTRGQTGSAILVLTLTTACTQLTQTPRVILVRRVAHRRLAIIQVFNVVLTSLTAIFLALKGITLWALLATDIVTLFISILGFYVVRPVWFPRFRWDSKTVRYFLSFGSRNFTGIVLLQVLNRIDKLWIGLYLGKTPLGFYSRANKFATYPNTLISNSIIPVIGGTFAELKSDPWRLSRAFYFTCSWLVRTGFFLAGSFALIAPELIRLVLGDKWIPMIDTFRLLLIYALFDPIKLILTNLFVAVGKPELMVKVRLIQLVVMGIGIFLLGFSMGIIGVALAMNIMQAVGIVMMLKEARAFVDFSPARMFSIPTLALGAGLVSGYGVTAFSLLSDGSDLQTGLIKLTVFTIVCIGVLFFFERRQFSEAISVVSGNMLHRTSAKGSQMEMAP